MKNAHPITELPNRTIADFWARAVPGKNIDDCWGWKGQIGVQGYAVLDTRYTKGVESLRAHRVSCFIHHGPAPKGAPCAIHSCDNKPCTNPRHVSWGNNSQNMIQFRQRGDTSNLPAGEKHGMCRLSEKTVLEILGSVESGNCIATRLGMDRSTINKIRSGVLWKHLHPKSIHVDLLKARLEWRRKSFQDALAGENHFNSILTGKQVKAIRASAASSKTLAIRYGVSVACIYDVRKGRSWGSLLQKSERAFTSYKESARLPDAGPKRGRGRGRGTISKSRRISMNPKSTGTGKRGR